MIKKQGSKFLVKNREGTKTLGTYDTEEAAKKRLKEIEYFSKTRGIIKK